MNSTLDHITNFLFDDRHASELLDYAYQNCLDAKPENAARFYRAREMDAIKRGFLAYQTACAMIYVFENEYVNNMSFSFTKSYNYGGEYRSTVVMGHVCYTVGDPKNSKEFTNTTNIGLNREVKDGILNKKLTDKEKQAFELLFDVMEELSENKVYIGFLGQNKVFTKENCMKEFKAAYPITSSIIDKFYLERVVKSAHEKAPSKKATKM